MIDFTKYPWLMPKSPGEPGREIEVAIVYLPEYHELRNFIKMHMTQIGRIVRISSWCWTNGNSQELLSLNDTARLRMFLHQLALEFHPWQFRMLCQRAGDQLECDWVEAGSFIPGKYDGC